MPERPSFLSVTPLVPAAPTIAEDLEFYTTQMGFEVVWQGGGMAGIRRGSVSMILVESDNRNWADNSSMGIGVEDLDALYEEYRGIPARVGPLEMKAWGRREFHVVVPSGVCFQFFQA